MAIKLSVTLDSSQAKQEVDALKEKIKDVKKSQQGEVSGQNITIKADDQASGSIKKVKEEIKSIPDKKHVTLDGSADSFSSKLKKGIAGVREEMTKLQGGAGKFVESFLAGGGAIGILIAGFASLVKLGKYFYEMWINGMKEAGEMAQRNAASIRESAEENEKLRQKTDGYMNSLSSLAANEKLSNANKAEARKLIEDLTKSYGDLGIKLDETTGKLTGVDSAFVKKAQKDKERRIKELEAELKQIQADNEAQAKVRDSAGIPVWFTGNVRIGGEEEQKEAAAKIEENNKRAMEIRKLLHEQRKIDPAKDLTAKRKAEIADLQNARKEQEEAFARQKKDDALADEKDYDKKIANRQALLDQQKREKVNPLEEKVKTAKTSFQNAKTDIDKLEAQKNLLQLQKELQSEYEKVYAVEKEIKALKNEQLEKEKAAAKAKADLLADAKKQTELNKLLVNGAQEVYEAEKLRLDLKKQGINLTKAETDELLKQQKLQKVQNLNKSLLDKAQELAWSTMKQSGLGLEAEKEKALLDAEKIKGGKLSSAEADLVKRLTELTSSASSARDYKFGDTSIKTNSLTARGGFQTGAVAPDKDRINQVISTTVKAMQQQQKEIRNLINDIKKALT